MNTVIIDPSIATLLKIKAVGKSERRPIVFTASEPWSGTYQLDVWNSPAKNTRFEIPSTDLSISNEVMTWWIDPSGQGLDSGTYYAEIKLEDIKSIIFKAEFEVCR
ncbi:MAG: hypothetical protein JST78_09495 [Bacteroidetes bacterium]|nr:hypothetical protein [Bacteroidota bacterium]